MASLRQLPSGRFNVQIRRKNEKPLSRSFDTKEEAERWGREQEVQLEGKPPHPQAPALTFLSLGTLYCDTILKGRPSRSITLYRIERITPHLPEDVTAITKFDINRYRLMRLGQVSPTTCRDELQIIHRLYRWARREMLIDFPSPCVDVPMPPPSKPRSRVVEKSELSSLLGVVIR
ncbi:hypothetical protein PHAMO_340161 [Magnetospirillum molischianum DSM 120]|uniref:Core-binding (CB) domain-containing protein n=1 Tax=Magnetospirillum molischianum DSM 120 TaxID=1150626 RepID=H8FVA0_MAGML|nr:hypothetical protein PHAMO_340161 [Magnetospirillum molischianum DSM 120]